MLAYANTEYCQRALLGEGNGSKPFWVPKDKKIISEKVKSLWTVRIVAECKALLTPRVNTPSLVRIQHRPPLLQVVVIVDFLYRI